MQDCNRVPASHLRWPTTLLSSLVVILAGLASLRQPLGPWLPYVGAGAFMSILACMLRYRPYWPVWLIAVVTALFVMVSAGDSFRIWRFVSSHPDAWSYGALSDYLKNHPRGLSEGMSLLDQWASHLQNTRFASSCILALSVWLTGHDHLIEAHALFYGVVLITMFFSMANLGRALELSHRARLVLGSVSTAFGWAANALVYGNYDNLLFIALMPAGLAAWLDMSAGRITARAFIIHAPVVTAALFYTYPEGLALSGMLALPLLVTVLWGLRRNRPRLTLAIGAGVIVAVLTAPFLSVFSSFLMNQVRYGVSALADDASRPGTGSFPGLLGPKFLPAFWSLGSEYPASPRGYVYVILPAVLFVLTGLGVWQLRKKRFGYPWVILPFGALLIWQALFSRFEYGTYKVIFCAQWWLFPAVVSGGLWLKERIPRPWAAGALMSLLVSGATIQRWNFHSYRLWPTRPAIQAASELPKVKLITRDKPLLLDISDADGQLWAVAYLRDQPLALVLPKSYLGRPGLLAQAKPVTIADEMLTLRSGRDPDAIWQNSQFSLLPKTSGSVLTTVENPNGLEAVDGVPFVWIAASKPTAFIIKAFRAGEFELGSRQLIFGGVPGPTHPIEVTDDSGTREVILRAGDLTIPVRLRAGMNRITIRSTAIVANTLQANGDTRELMLGLTGYFVKSASPARP